MNDYSNPTRTLELLDELEALGIPDQAFSIIHHFEKPEKIATHRRYCEMLREEGASFRTNSNRLVQRRLELLLTLYKTGQFTVKSRALFECLANAVVLEIPHDRRPLFEQIT